MIIKNSIVMALLLISVTGFSQATKTVQLKPIYKQGMSYFYDTKKVRGAYSLEIPLRAVNDVEVDKHFNRFRIIHNVRRLVYIPAFFIPLYVIGNRSHSAGVTFLYWYLGAVGVDLSLGGLAHRQVGKAIDLYNIAILDRNSIGLWLDTESSFQTTLNFGWKIKL